MKRSIFMFLVIGASMIFFCCSENQPTSPDLQQSDQVTTTLAKAKTTFTATAAIDCSPPLINPGTTTVLPNGKTKVRGVEVRYDMVMIGSAPPYLLNGALLWNTNKNIELDGYKAKLWGKMELFVGVGVDDDNYENADGIWELTWHGYKIGLDIVIVANGVGIEGNVKGMVAKWTMEMILPLKPNPNPGPPMIVDHCAKYFHSIEGYISK